MYTDRRVQRQRDRQRDRQTALVLTVGMKSKDVVFIWFQINRFNQLEKQNQ